MHSNMQAIKRALNARPTQQRELYFLSSLSHTFLLSIFTPESCYFFHFVSKLNHFNTVTHMSNLCACVPPVTQWIFFRMHVVVVVAVVFLLCVVVVALVQHQPFVACSVNKFYISPTFNARSYAVECIRRENKQCLREGEICREPPWFHVCCYSWNTQQVSKWVQKTMSLLLPIILTSLWPCWVAKTRTTMLSWNEKICEMHSESSWEKEIHNINEPKAFYNCILVWWREREREAIYVFVWPR